MKKQDRFGGAMKKVVLILFAVLVGCGDIISDGQISNGLTDYSKKEANLKGLLQIGFSSFSLEMHCFVDTNVLTIDSCLLSPESGIHRYEYPVFLKVQIKSSEDTAWNSILSYLPFKHSDKNFGWMVQPKGYYEGSEFIPSDTILIGDKYIPQKSLGVFEFEIRDSFGNKIKIGLDLHSRLPQVTKNPRGNLELRWPSDSLPTAVCIASLCANEDGCSSPLRILQVDSSVREQYSWFDFCLSGNEKEEIAIPDSSYFEKYGSFVAETKINWFVFDSSMTIESNCKRKGCSKENVLRQLFSRHYRIHYK